MRTQHYLALLSSDRQPRTTDQKIYLDMLTYLDQRHCLVKVWYHNRLPRWLQKNNLLASLWYLARLLWIPKSKIVVDYRLYSFLAVVLKGAKVMTSHELLVYTKPEYQQDKGRGMHFLWKLGLQNADKVMVDSIQSRQRLIQQGIQERNIVVLQPLHTFLSLVFKPAVPMKACMKENETSPIELAIGLGECLANSFEQMSFKENRWSQNKNPAGRALGRDLK